MRHTSEIVAADASLLCAPFLFLVSINEDRGDLLCDARLAMSGWIWRVIAAAGQTPRRVLRGRER